VEGTRIGKAGVVEDAVWPGAGGSIGLALAAGAGVVGGGVGIVAGGEGVMVGGKF
jgi:hypothetical protein